jgi:hypothetical protein
VEDGESPSGQRIFPVRLTTGSVPDGVIFDPVGMVMVMVVVVADVAEAAHPDWEPDPLFRTP